MPACRWRRSSRRPRLRYGGCRVYAKSPKAEGRAGGERTRPWQSGDRDGKRRYVRQWACDASQGGDSIGAAIDAVVKATSLPVIVKGITRPEDAKEAVAHGAKGVVVSNYRGVAIRRRSPAHCSYPRPSFKPLAIRSLCLSTAVSAAAPTFSRPLALARERRVDRPARSVGPGSVWRRGRAGRCRNATRPNWRDICACVAVHRSRRSTPACCVFTRRSRTAGNHHS